jgi:hypothetical protein
MIPRRELCNVILSMELLLNIKVESKKEWIKENKGNDGTTEILNVLSPLVYTDAPYPLQFLVVNIINMIDWYPN